MSSFKEMAREYRAADRLITERIKMLQAMRESEPDDQKKGRLEGRIHDLEAMRRDVRDQAVLLERYYERGYRRNARYTL